MPNVPSTISAVGRRAACKRTAPPSAAPGAGGAAGIAARCADAGHYPILKRRQAVTNRC
jgi:hypothetical protein